MRIILNIFLAFFCLFPTLTIGQNITGIVFNDANNNGIQDGTEVGVHDITVTAYDNTNASITTATTVAITGSYTLSGLTTGQTYRIEFTLPAPFNASGSGGTAVQFATPGETVNLGIYVGSEVCLESNPRLIAGCGVGNVTFNSSPTDPSMASWYFNSPNVRNMDYNNVNPYGADPHDEPLQVGQVGVPFGLAVQPRTKLVYMTSVAAPLTAIFPVAPNGIGAIYIADFSGAGTTFQGYKLLVDLSTYITVTGTNFFGKYGLGGADFSQDGKNLYTLNMGNGKLVKIDVSGVTYTSLPITAPTAGQITEIDIPAPYSTCTGGTFRPVALKEYGGKLYIGGMCDAFSSQNATDLEARIITYDYTANTWAQAFSFQPESFTAGNMIGLLMSQKPWIDPEPGTSLDTFSPVLTDITFDDTGSMILGITNRKVFNNNTNYETGYVVRTWRNADGSFSLENAGSVGPYNTLTTTLGFIPYITANYANPYTDGPGQKFFFEQSIQFHPFVYTGGVYVKPGSDEVVWGASDPISINALGSRYLSLTNGLIKRGITFTGQKISRITGVDAICDGETLEIGNRVWDDTNTNGRQDANELGLSNVQLTLTCGINTATTTTTTNGSYYFRDGIGDIATWPNGSIPRNTMCTLTLASTQSGKSFIPNSGTILDHIDSDGTAMSGTVSFNFTTGSNGQNNHTYDFAFGIPICTPPSPFSLSAIQPTCTHSTGTISFASFPNSGTFVYNYDDTTLYNTGILGSNAIATSGTSIDNLVPATYSVRLFNSTDSSCYTDATITLNAATGCTTGQPDLELTKTIDKTMVVSGDILTYTLTLRNVGTADATGVKVRDLLPAGLTYSSSTPSQGAYNPLTGMWNIDIVSQGATYTLVIKARVD